MPQADKPEGGEMSSYFDAKIREVCAAFDDGHEEFLATLRAVEAEVIRDVSQATGDRHFPEDLREKIQGKIAVWEARPGSRGEEHALMMFKSVLIEELHSLFHVLVDRRIQTPFGPITDHPVEFIKSRDEWAMETFGKVAK